MGKGANVDGMDVSIMEAIELTGVFCDQTNAL
jgi:hypothetical protein